MKFQISKDLVKQSLSAHSVVGLVVGAFMYILCLTGTLLVFVEYYERLEQRNIPEFREYTAETVSTAFQQYQNKTESSENSVYVILPTNELPRMHLSDGENEWYLDQQGNHIDPVSDGWTHMLKHLHIYLLLPETIGLIIVSALGAMLIGLIVSGVVAHPRIFKDAFKFRRGGNRRLEQTDLHNRLSVWGLPFHLMIGITGAFFGLVGLLVFVASFAFYGGDREALFADIYGADIEVEAPLQPLNTQAALQYMQTEIPEAEPIYVVAHHLGTEKQYMEIAATLPGRLIYSELYRFGADGEFINHQGLSDGPISRQIVYSVYRLHFGWFGGSLIRWLYVVMGLALTIVSVTGINIWLSKRSQQDWVDDAWPAIVWGFPASLIVSAVFNMAFGITAEGVLAATMLFSLAYCLWLRKGKMEKQEMPTNQTKAAFEE